MRSHTKETQDELTPEHALDILKEGNERFVNNIKAHRNLLEQVNDTSSGQFPFAAILSCIAVSYTHLRAHETVLDLVCRLLLEKKHKTKKNKNTTTTQTRHPSLHNI